MAKSIKDLIVRIKGYEEDASSSLHVVQENLHQLEDIASRSITPEAHITVLEAIQSRQSAVIAELTTDNKILKAALNSLVHELDILHKELERRVEEEKNNG